MSLAPGAKLGPYEILAPIGAGGMGEVYKARDTRLDRIVAIKTSKAQFSERFAREAKAIAALNHPHICQLYDVGPDYLVMEYVEGAPLKGPLVVEKAVEYAGQILSALDAAHRKGITHRDLKPANIMVTKQHGIKLLDFGLARIANGSADSTLTQPGEKMGTPAYMAPEQWEGRPGDARTDIYCFGCVLYEMLTGERVAQDRTPVEPTALESIIRTCLAKDPEDRWQSARDIKATLGLIGATPPAPARNPWRERVGWISMAALLGISLLLTLGRGRAPATGGEVVTFAIYPPENVGFSEAANTTVNVPQFALAPDGRSIVFSAQAPGAKSILWLRPMEQAGARALPGTEDAEYPFWSPDSRWIGFFAEGKLKKIPAAGGAVQVVVQAAPVARGGTWGPDGTIVFGVASGPLLRVSSSGGPVTPASILGSQEGQHRFPQFLPDGRHFLYGILASEQRSVYAGALDGKSTKLLPLRTNASATYAPPGYLLFVDGDTLLGQAFDAERLEVSGQPFLIAEHVGRSSTSQSGISASQTGTIAYAAPLAQNTRLTWFDRTGRALGSAGPEGYYPDFRLSPNEKSLSASLVDAKTGAIDIWMIDLARGNNTRITRGGLVSASAIWSPDGTHLVYRSIRNGQIQFYQKSAAGGGDEVSVLSAETERAAQIQSVNLVPTDWSPDGKHIVFSFPTVVYGNDLWLLPLTGDRKPVKFLATPGEEMHGNFSPDGHLIAYTSNESGKFEVYVQSFPLTDVKQQVSTKGGYEPRWRGDGREIYYLSEDRKLMASSVGPGPSFGVPQSLFQTRVPAGVNSNRTHYVPSRDGQRFLVNTQSGDLSPTPITVVLNWTAGLKR